MVCQACGNPIAGPGAFCPHCGAQAAPYASIPAMPPPPLAYARPRVARHIQTLGILWFVYGVYRAATGLFAALVIAGFAPRFGLGPWGMPTRMWDFAHGTFWTAIMATIAVYTGITALLSFLVGYGLTTRRPWGRTLAIVTAILALIRIPAGTALGAYTLWVLAPSTSGFEYEAIADRT